MRPFRRLLSNPPERLAVGLATTLAMLSAAGCRRPAARAEPPPPVVGVVESRRMTVPVLATPTGTTRALREVTIRARVRGFLNERHFEEGSFVKKGQLLFVIDEEQYEAALQSARASQAEAEAALKKAEQSKAREVATAQLALARAQLLLAQIQERRAQALLARNAASREELDKAEADRQRWEAQVDADRANLEQSKADYDVGIATAKARVDAAKAAVRDAELNLGYCRMSAPIDGRIGEAKVRVGNLVGPESAGGGQFTELATIQQLDPMGVDIQVGTRYLERATHLIEQGLTIRLFRPGLRGEVEHPQQGVVYFLDNTVNPTTSTFLCKARVPNPRGTLLPGEYVNILAVVETIENAVVVPAQAVRETETGTVVYVVDGQGKVAIQSVEAAQTYEGQRVIMQGLDAGVPVIVEGLQLVRPGAVVRTEPAVLPRPVRDVLKGAGPATDDGARKGAASKPAPAGSPTTGEAPGRAPRTDGTNSSGPAPGEDATSVTAPAPARAGEAPATDRAGRPDRPVVQPGGPRSAVVEAVEAGRPARKAGDAPK